MTRLALLVVAVVIVALRAWARLRRRTSGHEPRRSGLGPFTSDVGLVAAREMRERFRGRVFRVGSLLMLAAVGAAIVIPTLGHGKPQPQSVGVVGALSAPLRATIVASANSAGTAVRFVAEPNESQVDQDLRSGRLDLAIVDGRTLVVDTAADGSSTTAQLAQAVAQELGYDEAVGAAHLSSAQSAALAGARPLPLRSLQPEPRKKATTKTTATTSAVGLVLVFLMLTQYNTWILIGVMEEKSSRVIEVLLAAVRPMRLLTGKVLGIGLVALAQAGAIVVFALALGEGVGSDLLHGTAPVTLVSTLVWLFLGYAFYCWVYAAAGSLVERQDQVQSLAFPLSLPIVFGYIMAITTVASGNASLLFKVLSYLPPTAPFAMPVMVGLGEVTWLEFCASALVSIVCTVGVARLANSIYRRAVLRTGRRVKLRDVVGLAH